MKKSSILFVFLLLPLFIFNEEPEKDRLSVMDVQDEDKLFDKKTVTRATDYIFSKFDSTRLFWMVPKSDRDVALDQAIDETLEGSRRECVDEKCQMSLVAQLQANFLINTKIKKLYHGTCNISISKFDVEKRAGVGTWNAKFNCAEKGLYEAIDGFNFGDASRKSISFQTGKLGKLEDTWTPEMAGTGEQIIVYFESDPSGATISIDGEVAGQTPKFKSKMIAAGKHQIMMEKEDYYTETKIMYLKKGDKVEFSLYDGISIQTEPSGAMVRIDGVLVCQNTPCKRVLNEGKREIIIQKELYETKKETAVIKRGKDIHVSLEPNFGWLEIISEDDGIKIYLDGKNIGETPIAKIPLDLGPHRIDPQSECFSAVSEQFVIEKSKTQKVFLEVQQKEAAIKVMAKDGDDNDIEADIIVDGKNIGTAPGIFKVPLCSKELKIESKAGNYKQSLELSDKSVFTIDAELKTFSNKGNSNKSNDYEKEAQRYAENIIFMLNSRSCSEVTPQFIASRITSDLNNSWHKKTSLENNEINERKQIITRIKNAMFNYANRCKIKEYQYRHKSDSFIDSLAKP